MNKSSFAFLLSPMATISGIAIGVILGIYVPGAVFYLEPVGEVYLAVLQMCVIPIMASAVVISIGKLVKSDNVGRYMVKILLVFLVLLLLVSSVGILLGLVAKPQIASESMRQTIGNLVIQSADSEGGSGLFIQEIDSRHSTAKTSGVGGLTQFLIDIIPTNIFSALAIGESLKIIFFFGVMGFAIKSIANTSYLQIITLAEGVFQAFQTVIKGAMYLLPFGLVALTATQFSSVGFATLTSLATLLVWIYIAAVCIFLLCTVLIWLHTGGSYFKQFAALRDTILICLGTRSSFAAIPATITGLTRGLNLAEDGINLTVPLGVTLCRYGNVMIFAFAAVFGLFLYDYPLTIGALLIISLASVLTGMATAGAPGIVARTMIVAVLDPLGIPASGIIVVLIALDPLIDPVMTLINVYPNCAAAAIISGERRTQARSLSKSGVQASGN